MVRQAGTSHPSRIFCLSSSLTVIRTGLPERVSQASKLLTAPRPHTRRLAPHSSRRRPKPTLLPSTHRCSVRPQLTSGRGQLIHCAPGCSAAKPSCPPQTARTAPVLSPAHNPPSLPGIVLCHPLPVAPSSLLHCPVSKRQHKTQLHGCCTLPPRHFGSALALLWPCFARLGSADKGSSALQSSGRRLPPHCEAVIALPFNFSSRISLFPNLPSGFLLSSRQLLPAKEWCGKGSPASTAWLLQPSPSRLHLHSPTAPAA